MNNILKIRRRFQRANRALNEARDEALLHGGAGIPAVTPAALRRIKHVDGTNRKLYAAAVKLRESGVYSASSSNTTVALALLKRIRKATGESWETTINKYAPEWANPTA
jgi:hypothetical protein